jgi:hypothetical protein
VERGPPARSAACARRRCGVTTSPVIGWRKLCFVGVAWIVAILMPIMVVIELCFRGARGFLPHFFWSVVTAAIVIVGWKLIGAAPFGSIEHLRGSLAKSRVFAIASWVASLICLSGIQAWAAHLLQMAFPEWDWQATFLPVPDPLDTSRVEIVMFLWILLGLPILIFYFRSLVPESLGYRGTAQTVLPRDIGGVSHA